MSPAERAGAERCVAMLCEISDTIEPGFETDQESAEEILHHALSAPMSSDERRGFERALARFIAIVTEGCVPDYPYDILLRELNEHDRRRQRAPNVVHFRPRTQ